MCGDCTSEALIFFIRAAALWPKTHSRARAKANSCADRRQTSNVDKDLYHRQSNRKVQSAVVANFPWSRERETHSSNADFLLSHSLFYLFPLHLLLCSVQSARHCCNLTLTVARCSAAARCNCKAKPMAMAMDKTIYSHSIRKTFELGSLTRLKATHWMLVSIGESDYIDILLHIYILEPFGRRRVCSFFWCLMDLLLHTMQRVSTMLTAAAVATAAFWFSLKTRLRECAWELSTGLLEELRWRRSIQKKMHDILDPILDSFAEVKKKKV